MTIKQRLVISNILMVVIPVFISVIIILAGIFLSNQYWKSIDESENSIYEDPDMLLNATRELIHNQQSPDPQKIRKLNQYLKKNTMKLSIYSARQPIYTFGITDIDRDNKMMKAIQMLPGDASLTMDQESVYVQNIDVDGKTYTVAIFSKFAKYNSSDGSYELYRFLSNAFLVLLGIGTIITVIFTNRFLTHFVFRHIRQPLDNLVHAVHEIRDGNLDAHIHYPNNDEFASVCRDFNDMAVQLKQSLHLIQRQEENRKELLASISHDLRSPLTSIRAYSEGLLDGVASTPESRHNYISMIKTKAEDIDRMVAKIFLFSKMDMGDYPYDPERLDVNQELLSLIRATAEEYWSRGLDIELDVSNEPALIIADQVQFDSIFTNILENSLNYKDKERCHIRISTRLEDQQLLIRLTDNGPGVPEESLGKLFDAFYRSDPSRNLPHKGSGLGLAITAKAVERMGGHIEAKLSPAGGLCIEIHLPVIR
ncbi:sensor histidine kinase [Paenibacillus wulumuqiensis]|uniref:sensor histidine kinase n=1 Tax=Paenibacillus wulumuqiensis TaxID=1567107 RepID=UPI0006195BC0|nr:HAMP domain-containing sensor histidine kinase [Paenibacillus wulumuqiensis]